MRYFEILFLSLSSLWLILLVFLPDKQRKGAVVFWIMVASLLCHLVFEGLRWQLTFGYLLIIVGSIFQFKKGHRHWLWRSLGVFFGVTCIALSFLYAAGMPIGDFSGATGPHDVGCEFIELADQSRIDPYQASQVRKVFLKIWYPANPVSVRNANKASMWQELYEGDGDWIQGFMGYLKKTNSSSYHNVPVDRQEKYPMLVFNHALSMFPSQNTRLLEFLASHGYVVISIGHPSESLRLPLSGGVRIAPFLESWEAFQEAMAWIETTSKPILRMHAEMSLLSDREDRAALVLKMLSKAPQNDIVELWSEDSRFVIEQIYKGEVVNWTDAIDLNQIGVLGMSIGGATATELTKTDDRVSAGVNIDGLAFGPHFRKTIDKPFLSISSGDGLYLNDFLWLQSDTTFLEYSFPATKHADFTDFPVVWPIMQTYGQLGQEDFEELHRFYSVLILAFFDRYLKMETNEYPDTQDYQLDIRFLGR